MLCALKITHAVVDIPPPAKPYGRRLRNGLVERALKPGGLPVLRTRFANYKPLDLITNCNLRRELVTNRGMAISQRWGWQSAACVYDFMHSWLQALDKV